MRVGAAPALLGLLVHLLVLDAGVPTAAVPHAPASTLIDMLRHRHALAAFVRGGGGGSDATPPLLTPGFAMDDDETEELVVDSPGNQVLPSSPPDRGLGAHERGCRVSERADAGIARAPTPGMTGSSASVLRAWGSGAAQASMAGQYVSGRSIVPPRPGTPAPARRMSQDHLHEPEPAALSIDARMQLLETTLSERTSDWAQRVKALKDLYNIMENVSQTHGADTAASDNRAGVLFLRMVPALCTQIQDKRSSLVKQVCSTINDISHILGDAFEPAAAKLVPALLSLTFVTVRVISVAAL